MKTTMFTLNKVAKIRKLDRAKCWQRCGYIVANVLLGECTLVQTFWRTVWHCLANFL